MAMSARSRDPLDLVSLRQLRYFVSAMRAHSFSAASRDASISQAALSEQIALLESRSEEHTSELQSQSNLVCRLLLEKKKKTHNKDTTDRTRRHRCEDG